MGKLFILGSPEDFSLVAEEFEEMNFDVRSCLNYDEALQLIKHECEQSNQPIAVLCCGSFRDFQTILHCNDIAEHSVGVILCNLFENLRTVEEIIAAQSSLSDIGKLDFELVHETFEHVDDIRDILRICVPINGNKRQYFVPRNQKIPNNSKYSCRKVFPRKILRRWDRFKIWTDFFNFLSGNLTKKNFLLYLFCVKIFIKIKTKRWLNNKKLETVWELNIEMFIRSFSVNII